MTSALLQHLSGESLNRHPVWLMRQAGRYLPSYRAIRKQHSFWEMVTQPKVAAEVSLLPTQLNVDAVILFSDILTLPYSLEIDVQLKESIGPTLEKPLRTPQAFEIFDTFKPSQHTHFVGEALEQIDRQLPEETTRIGFAGAPWTMATYLVEGRANRQYEHLKAWLYKDPESLSQSLQKLANATRDYLSFQIEKGAQVVQLFDTWISEMPLFFFEKYYMPILDSILKPLEGLRAYYVKRAPFLYAQISELPFDILSVDDLLPLDQVDTLTKGKFHLQGNLDPTLLLTNESTIRKHCQKLSQTARQLTKPPILNLGHGVLQHTPVEHVKLFIQEASKPWN